MPGCEKNRLRGFQEIVMGQLQVVPYTYLSPQALSSSFVSLHRRDLKLNTAPIQLFPHCLLMSGFPTYKLSPYFSAYFTYTPKKVHQKPMLPQIYQSSLLSLHLVTEHKNTDCKHICLKFALLVVIAARCSYLSKPEQLKSISFSSWNGFFRPPPSWCLKYTHDGWY